jgi:hypothetical protein
MGKRMIPRVSWSLSKVKRMRTILTVTERGIEKVRNNSPRLKWLNREKLRIVVAACPTRHGEPLLAQRV